MPKPHSPTSIIPDETIEARIYFIRGKKDMLDRELAALYGVQTKVLNQAVKRNAERFPDDFMFQLNKQETLNWKSQIVTSNSDNRTKWAGENALMPSPSRAYPCFRAFSIAQERYK